ncbi:hypothetical protein EES41_23085 [Streptomyces sp. ADI95-16]|uniref:hypothetical protein n=1 Tax=Streptomyces sp. ADI95-16 TaxID=1522758 RepID=UPI000F3A8B6C|nr:hypothetical protein [Streptomyces sp. ADI95-16]AYV29603.1 hypothetical protein EES41_23085 [Streptomyces sp. ADI95-16]
MIGEPELDGEWESARPGERAEPERLPGPTGAPRGRWWWLLGGVVLASAVWGGALVVQDRFAASAASAGPRISYRHVEDLCARARLSELVRLTGQPFEERHTTHGSDPALDWASCGTAAGWSEGRTAYGSEVLVELHRRSDPGTEFGLGPGRTLGVQPNAFDVSEVPGLGERALYRRGIGLDRAELIVLDGGAVFTLRTEWFEDIGPDPTAPAPTGGPDETGLQTAMIEDMRSLMERLRA